MGQLKKLNNEILDSRVGSRHLTVFWTLPRWQYLVQPGLETIGLHSHRILFILLPFCLLHIKSRIFLKKVSESCNLQLQYVYVASIHSSEVWDSPVLLSSGKHSWQYGLVGIFTHSCLTLCPCRLGWEYVQSSLTTPIPSLQSFFGQWPRGKSFVAAAPCQHTKEEQVLDQKWPFFFFVF